jgi:hypothetical protein
MSFFELMKKATLKVKSYKSFGSDGFGLEGIEAINLIVGRNNSGKSALLDVVQYSCGNFQFQPSTQNLGVVSEVYFDTTVPENILSRVFSSGTSGGPLPGNHWAFGRQYADDPISIYIRRDNGPKFRSIRNGEEVVARSMFEDLAAQIHFPLEGKSFKRLLADRDVVPEIDNSTTQIAPNGSGFTNVVQRFLNQSSLPNSLVEKNLLTELNHIFSPDANFKRIQVRRHDSNEWEVYLEEEGKGSVALTNSGSGIKTILLVLGFLILLPHIEGKALSNYVFAFEELENNLHPSLQRRLLKFIIDYSLKHEFLVFLTSHSSAVIDMLSHDDFAQIVHVTHSGASARARRVNTYIESRGILDDLDVRASDLLQSNGIVWVEGPSDRLYFNHWIKLITDGLLEEGLHYQCVFYGGRLLAHLSGSQPFDSSGQEQAIKIFGVNRNAVVVIDSDSRDASSQINATKARVVSEVEALGGYAWVTAGREIENYIPQSALHKKIAGLTEVLGPYEDFGIYLDRQQSGEGRRFERNKVLYAEEVLPFIEREDMSSQLDLESKMLKISQAIAGWNRISPTWISDIEVIHS